MKFYRWLAWAWASLLAPFSWAQDGGQLQAPPSPEVLRDALDYYYRGQARGPGLVEFIPCLKVETAADHPRRFECLEPVQGPIPKNTVVYAWSLWFLPEKSSYEDISVQFVHEGTIRTTLDLLLGGSGRSRTWKQSTLSKPGKWTLRLLHRGQSLAERTIEVR